MLLWLQITVKSKMYKINLIISHWLHRTARRCHHLVWIDSIHLSIFAKTLNVDFDCSNVWTSSAPCMTLPLSLLLATTVIRTFCIFVQFSSWKGNASVNWVLAWENESFHKLYIGWITNVLHQSVIESTKINNLKNCFFFVCFFPP